LVAFLRAAELGSFAAAAKRLNISPAALGQTVKRLEGGFGVRLFNRTTRKMSLTPEGRLLYERCRRPVAELDELARVFDDSRGVVVGPLRLSAPLGFGRRHVLPLVTRFMAKHPDVTVTLDASDAVRDFVDDPVDIAFRIMRPTDSSMIARPISRLQAVTVAAPGYLRRHGIPQQPRDIEARSCISYRHPATGALAPWMFRIGSRDLVVEPEAKLVVNDIETGCDAAAAEPD
jgi:DNA-binding transcriptional LysR family regulator